MDSRRGMHFKIKYLINVLYETFVTSLYSGNHCYMNSTTNWLKWKSDSIPPSEKRQFSAPLSEVGGHGNATSLRVMSLKVSALMF